MSQNLLLPTLFLLISVSVVGYPIIHTCEDATDTGIYTFKYKTWELDVMCDMDTDGGGWLVILTRRGGFEDFYRPWDLYKNRGVGSPLTEYILPL